MILYANRVRTRANLSNYVVHEGYRRFDHFFGTVYCPSLDHAGRPYGLFVDGNNDTVGAASAVDKLATGLD